MLIYLTDINQTICLDTITFSEGSLDWFEDWFATLFDFPAEKYDAERRLQLTKAEYESYKITAQDYMEHVTPEGMGICLCEELVE